MEGKIMLGKCPQNVKDIIAKKFDSLESFYDLVLLLTQRQHVYFLQKKQYYCKEIDDLKKYLAHIGIDSMLADELVDEISNDYCETLCVNYAKKLLGEDWQEKINNFEKIINY